MDANQVGGNSQWATIILACLNMINLSVSSWNAQRLAHVRREQTKVATALNGGPKRRKGKSGS